MSWFVRRPSSQKSRYSFLCTSTPEIWEMGNMFVLVSRVAVDLEPVAVSGLQAIKHKVVLIKDKSKCLPVMSWTIQEWGQATFPNSLSPTGLSLGCQCQNWTELGMGSSLLALGAFKHRQDISDRSMGWFLAGGFRWFDSKLHCFSRSKYLLMASKKLFFPHLGTQRR